MSEPQMRALFLLAGIDVLGVWQLANEYWPEHPDYDRCRHESPWWLVRTPFGLVKIGWRKRVISIHWIDTPLRGEVTHDDVTKDETMVHAWGYAKAVEYLDTLRLLAKKAANVAALTPDRAEPRRTNE